MTETNRDHDIDVHIGRRLRARRRSLGVTQPQLAEAVGVRFQQIQKYESGEDRISASRLWKLCAALEATVDYFYEGLATARATFADDETDEHEARRDAITLARSYQLLGEEPRRLLLDLARTMNGRSMNGRSRAD
jgi:transcriptional regulator with XRE-family HTH domain